MSDIHARDGEGVGVAVLQRVTIAASATGAGVKIAAILSEKAAVGTSDRSLGIL